MAGKVKEVMKRAVSSVAVRLSPTRWKEYNELAYWRARKRTEGTLSNDHYKHFYTGHFGLDESQYGAEHL